MGIYRGGRRHNTESHSKFRQLRREKQLMTMKRKLESSIKQFPKLFGGKRTSSEREDESPPPSSKPTANSSSTSGVGTSEGVKASQSEQPNTSRTSFFSAGRLKTTGRTPAVDLNSVLTAAKPSEPPVPAKDPALASGQPTRSYAKIDQTQASMTTTNVPMPAQPAVAKSAPIEVPLPGGSVESLDDFSLRRLLDKRLFTSETPGSEVILVIRLSPNASGAIQLATSLGRVLTKDEKKKKEVLLVFTRLPVMRLHGVMTSSTNMLSISWSFPLLQLLAVRETKRGVVVLQFNGGKERRIMPISEAEKGWLFYGVTRLSREYVGTDPTIIAFSSIRLIATEDSLNSRCPFLVKAAPPVVKPAAAAPRDAQQTSKRKTDISFVATSDFDVSNGGENDQEDTAEENVVASLGRHKRASLIVTEEEARVLNKVFPLKTVSDTPEDLITRSKAQLIQLEKETLAELRAWESGAGPTLVKKSVTDVDHGRRGDPIASLLAHLEDVEANLRNLDDWMNAHDSSVLGMTTIARRIDSEIKNMREEGIAKERLASHLKELLEDLSPEDDQILTEISALLPVIQRELESGQAHHPIAVKLIRACRALTALRDRGGGDSRISARRDRFKRMKEKSLVVAAKLSEFLQGRLDYYYKFERADVREAHGRLVTYLDLFSCLSAMNTPQFNQVHARYQTEAGLFAKNDLVKLMDSYFTSPLTSPADTVGKYPDCSIDSTPEALRLEQEIAVKEVHMIGVESRRRFISRLRSIIKEEDAFCQVMGNGFDFTPGLLLTLDGLWQSFSQRAQTCPMSFAAPVLFDFEDLSFFLEQDDKPFLSDAVKNRMVLRLRDVLDRFLVDQVGSYFDKAKRSNTLFVRKYPGVIDRLDAAAKGFGDSNAGGSAQQRALVVGRKTVTDSVLQLIAAQPSPFHRLENLHFLFFALKLRAGRYRGDSSVAFETVVAEVEKRHDAAMKDVVEALLEASAFANVMQLVRASEEEQGFALTKTDLDGALFPLQNGGVERSVTQTKAMLDSKIASFAKLRAQVMEAARDSVIDGYWRFADLAADMFGVSVQPSASLVKDQWFRV